MQNKLSNPMQKARFNDGLFVSITQFQPLLNWITDLIFPPTCHHCGKVDTHWCETCYTALAEYPITKLHLDSSILDEICTTAYHQYELQSAIQAFKYNGVISLAIPLGMRLAHVLESKKWTFDTIIPVPLFADRLQNRGYNQSYLLAQQVGKMINIPYTENLLLRYRDTNQQVGLTASERRENVKNAFTTTTSVEGQSFLLIDDVVTTGSTLEECATALRNAGAVHVYAITVTRA